MCYLNRAICFYFIIGAALFLHSSVLNTPCARAATELHIKKRLPDLLISADSAILERDHKRDVLFVDVRQAVEYEKLRIPGSVNIPVFAIKTKTYLKKNTIIIIDEAHKYSQIETECSLLRKSGFKVWIMDGGLYAWSRKGGALEGDAFVRKTLNRMTPIHFFPEKDYQDWIILFVGVDKSKEVSVLFPEAIFMSDLKDENAFIAAYEKIVNGKNKASDSFTKVMIINERGKYYEYIERILQKTALQNIFFLEGGMEAYKKYIKGREFAINKPSLQKNNICFGGCR